MAPPITIQFVNHASVKLVSETVSIVSDPWLWGCIFNNGWSLLWTSDELFPVAADSDFIWVSHEHPDHFSPAFFRRLLGSRKPRVLFQATRDSRVAQHLSALGFAVREVKHLQRVELTHNDRFLIGRNGLYDSWCVFESGGKRIVNLNDCIIKSPGELRRIRRRIGAVDVLLTQFSYAGWVGDRHNSALHRQAAQRRLEVVRTQIECLEPEFVIPFASYAWYSHEENAYLNASVNHVTDFLDVCARTPSTPIVLQPLETWEVGSPHDNGPATEFWERALTAVSSAQLTSTAPVADVRRLQSQCDAYRTRMFATNSKAWMRAVSAVPLLGLFRPITIRLTDLGATVRFSFFNGLRENLDQRPADIEMSSDSLSFIFAHDFGFDTLMVNARFNATKLGLDAVIRNFAIGNLNAMGWQVGTAMFRTMLRGFRFGVVALILRELKNVNPE